jgi:hypothetical protein
LIEYAIIKIEKQKRKGKKYLTIKIKYGIIKAEK